MPAISCSAPGKIILCGEHAVVYGYPAIALPVFQVSTTTRVFAKPNTPTNEAKIVALSIDMDCNLADLSAKHPLAVAIQLTLDELGVNALPACELHITSTLPVGAGLGSSASTTVSLVRGVSTFLGHPLSNEQVNRIAFEVEKIHHSSPSGIDNTVITYQTPIYLKRGEPVIQLRLFSSLCLVIADSGLRCSTAKAVQGVRLRWEQDKEHFTLLFEGVKEITNLVLQALKVDEILSIGPLLTRNHEILRDIGVSNPKLDELVMTALGAGAWGAKLSGGGLGGNIIALVNPETSAEVEKALIRAGATSTLTSTIFPREAN